MSPQSLFGLYLTVPNIDEVLDAAERLQNKLPNTVKAVQQATLIVQQVWQGYALGARVTYSGGTFVIQSRNGAYAQSIQRQFPYRGRTSGLVFSNSKIAELIEEGYGPFDMKTGLLNSPKAKVSQKGTRYITVPFRHNVPSAGATGAAMPQAVYNQASKLDFSQITGRSPWGTFTYAWGGRLPASPQGQRSKLPVGGMTGAYTWATGMYSGMVRMTDTATPGRSGGYLTFRRVSENSDPNSWWHPGVKPRPVTQAVIENTEPTILKMLRTGAALDLAMTGLPIPRELR